MPDEEGNKGAEEGTETPLHAHGSGIEEENERPREDQIEGEMVDDEDDEASDSENTGGATSGGPPQEDAGEDPSNV